MAKDKKLDRKASFLRLIQENAPGDFERIMTKAVKNLDPNALMQLVNLALEAGVNLPTQAKPAAKRKRGSRASRTSAPEAWQFKITLKGSKPPIWRRVVVPSDITLFQFHGVIQQAMGWTDSHLHMFDIDGESYQLPPSDGFDDGYGSEDETKYNLRDLIDTPKSKFLYTYDFGDDWEHAIVLEKIIPAEEKPAVFVCLAGKGACPPEDSGGLWGHYNNLKILVDPKNPEHETIKEWMGGEFDPDDFDIDEVNRYLGPMRT